MRGNKSLRGVQLGRYTRGMTIGPGKALAIGGVMSALVVFGAAYASLIPGLTLPGLSGGQVSQDSDDVAGEQQKSNLKSLLAANEQMKDVMRQQMKQEADEMIQRCLESGGNSCGDLALLEQLCADDNVLGLESCGDPRLQQLLQKQKKG